MTPLLVSLLTAALATGVVIYYRSRYLRAMEEVAVVKASAATYRDRAKALATHVHLLEAARNARAAIRRKKEQDEAAAIRDSDDADRARDFLRDSLPHGK